MVIAVIAILTSILMPGFRTVRDTGRRLVCSNNLRSIGVALRVHSMLQGVDLPSSYFGNPLVGQPQEMMSATTGMQVPIDPESPGFLQVPPVNAWEGLGKLVQPGFRFLDDPRCLYCPCHRGKHTFEVFAEEFRRLGQLQIYTNYHFIGDVRLDSEEIGAPRRVEPTDAVVTDGLRTDEDMNHEDATNVLRGDGSVDFWKDSNGDLAALVPGAQIDPALQVERYNEIWRRLNAERH